VVMPSHGFMNGRAQARRTASDDDVVQVKPPALAARPSLALRRQRPRLPDRQWR
jgi:hypothetical protein